MANACEAQTKSGNDGPGKRLEKNNFMGMKPRTGNPSQKGWKKPSGTRPPKTPPAQKKVKKPHPPGSESSGKAGEEKKEIPYEGMSKRKNSCQVRLSRNWGTLSRSIAKKKHEGGQKSTERHKPEKDV